MICRKLPHLLAFVSLCLPWSNVTAQHPIARDIPSSSVEWPGPSSPQYETLPSPLPEVQPPVDDDSPQALRRLPPAMGNHPGRPRIGVVLGGGGAAGVCHVGVLKVLEEYGIPVDCIAGTSMGSIVAGLYATGLTANELEQIVYQFRWDEILAEPESHAMKYERRKTDDYLFVPAITVGVHAGKASLGSGFVSGQSLTLQLRRMLASANGVCDFDRLPIPFRTVATDLETGEAVVFRRGNLATAIRASMSIPGVFPPVRCGDRLLIDGGLRDNVPVDLAREMGADIVIVVRIPPDLKSRDQLTSLFSVSSQALSIMAAHDNSHQATGLSELDILIQPDMRGIGALDFARAREAVAIGAQAAHQSDDQLRALAGLLRNSTVTPTPNTEPSTTNPPASSRVQLEAAERIVVDQIEIENSSPLMMTESIAARLTVRPGEPFTLDQLEHDIQRIYETDHFGNVDYELSQDGLGQSELSILTTPDPRGASLLSLGVGLEENFSGDSFYTSSASLSLRNLNQLGGEARLFGQLGSRQRLEADFFQPLEPSQSYFLRPYLSFEGYVQPIVIQQQKTAEFILRRYRAGIEAGRTIGDYAVATAGTLVESSNLDLVTGPAYLKTPDDYASLGGGYLGLKFDSLDSYFFPTGGFFAEANYTLYGNWFGDAESSDLLAARTIYARSHGPHVAILRCEAVVDDLFSGTTLRSESTTGGFLRLSGYSKHEIIAARRVQAAAVYMREMAQMFGTRVTVYRGVSAEIAYFDGTTLNAPSNRPVLAGSIFLAVNTPIGPLFAGYGLADSAAKSPFIAMGQVF